MVISIPVWLIHLLSVIAFSRTIHASQNRIDRFGPANRLHADPVCFWVACPAVFPDRTRAD